MGWRIIRCTRVKKCYASWAFCCVVMPRPCTAYRQRNSLRLLDDNQQQKRTKKQRSTSTTDGRTPSRCPLHSGLPSNTTFVGTSSAIRERRRLGSLPPRETLLNATMSHAWEGRACHGHGVHSTIVLPRTWPYQAPNRSREEPGGRGR